MLLVQLVRLVGNSTHFDAATEPGMVVSQGVYSSREFFDEHAEQIEKADWVTLNARNKELVCICLKVLDKVRRRLLSWNGDEWDTLISQLEPDSLGALHGAPLLLFATVTLTLSTIGFLFLFDGSR